eukprot:33069_1
MSEKELNQQQESSFTGYLLKQSLHMKQFRKRWMKLSGCFLQSFKPNTTTKTEQIDLRLFKCVIIMASNQFALKSKDNKTQRIFKICNHDHKESTSENTNLDYEARSQETINFSKMRRWIDHLTQAQSELECCVIRTLLSKVRVRVNSAKNDDMLFVEEFTVKLRYKDNEKMLMVCDRIMTRLRKKYYPLKIEFKYINGFTKLVTRQNLHYLYKRNINSFDVNKIVFDGLYIGVEIKYNHMISSHSLNCSHMVTAKTKSPLRCPIYLAMKEKYQFSEQNLYHLMEFTHFNDMYNEKPECKYNDDCHSFKRLEVGGNDLKDRCHMALYLHPPRRRQIKLAENINSLILNKSRTDNHKLFHPEQQTFSCSANIKSTVGLIQEVIENGYKYDLCLECSPIDKCEHKDYSMLSIVDNKLQHFRHRSIRQPLNRAEMLSLVLYTGCECNYDLCKSQRNGNYDKWKWFDYHLYNAIKKLSAKESGAFPVYSG